jgi:hypothetical protein
LFKLECGEEDNASFHDDRIIKKYIDGTKNDEDKDDDKDADE